MQVLRGPIRHDKDGATRISVEIVVDPKYLPGQCHQIEADLQAKLNEVAVSGMEVVLSRFDTHGEPITLGGRVYTSKGRSPATYQCYGGAAQVERHVYQTSEGGKTFCPLEDRARMIADTTPHFAAIVAGKYSANSGRETRIDLQRGLQREVGLEYVQNLAQSVGRSALAQENHLAYEVKTPESEVEAIVVAADATCVPLVKESYKQASAGCFCLLNKEGDLLEKIYLAEVPEEGKRRFWARMEQETRRLKERFPLVPWFGLSDGAVDIQEWLEKHCDMVTLDFYHLSQYVIGAKEAFGLTEAQQKQWVEKTLHALKHEEGAAERLLKQLKRKSRAGVENKEAAQAVVKALSYVERNRERMEYALLGEENLPIGSGVIEGACKFVIKQRACGSGMKWKRKALRSVLALRSLYVSSNRWEQFWRRCAIFGY